MSPEIAAAARKYAKASGTPTGVFAEMAFLEYMQNHPLEHLPLVVNRVDVENIQIEMDRLDMEFIGKQIKFLLGKLVNGDGNKAYLVEGLKREMRKGFKVKKPSKEFAGLLEEAMKHI